MGEPNPPTAWVRLYPWSLSEAKQGHFSSVQHQSVYTCVCVEVAGLKVRRKSHHHPSRFTVAGALVINGPRRTHSSIFYIWEPCSLITRATYNTNTMLTNVHFIAKGHPAWEQFATHKKFILCLHSLNRLQVHR